MVELKDFIRDVPDFPKPGILFKDITPLLKSPKALAKTIRGLAEPFLGKHIDAVVGIESRGFIFGVPLASVLQTGFIPIRKPGRLPAKTVEVSYGLEYGSDRVSIHEDSIQRGQKVVLVDDLLATGGTMGAAVKLIQQLGGDIVGIVVVIELTSLGGRSKLNGYPIHSLLQY